MTLLLDEIDVLETSGDPSSVDVRGVEHDSRRVAPGDLYCCLPGRGTDGHRHAPEAVERGAVGVVCEHPVSALVGRPVVQVRVAPGAARPAMARLAAALYRHPARDLVMAGVTGTNGKTTVTHLLATVLEQSGLPATVIGTLGGARTTPESSELQRLLAEVRDAAPPQGAAVALEVSSHALVQARVDGIHFDVAVFTNLSHDHLDFHGTMEDYFEAKASLFTPERALRGVVGTDDEWGRRLVRRARIPVVEVRREQAGDVELAAGRTELTWRGQRVRTRLTGLLNVDNTLLAGEAAVALGLDPVVVAAGLAVAAPVPGRLEPVVSDGASRAETTVLVDYAHTPAALEAALDECRRLAGGRGAVSVVFGCGGDRDRAKRPLMGAAAARLADRVYVTSDNPRHEDPGSIIEQVLAGVPAPPGARARTVVEPDRRAAIAAALTAAAPGDVVLVAGKGHEAYQDLADERRPFDDRAVVAELLAERTGA